MAQADSERFSELDRERRPIGAAVYECRDRLIDLAVTRSAKGHFEARPQHRFAGALVIDLGVEGQVDEVGDVGQRR
jgi:hypothetical protein